METPRGRGCQQVGKLGSRKAEDGTGGSPGQAQSPLWAWLSSLSPEGPACGGARSLKAPREERACWSWPPPLGTQYRVMPSGSAFHFGVWKYSISSVLGE